MNEVRKRILKMMIPIVSESIVQLSASTVSMAIIGKVSFIAIGAIGLASRITQLVWALFKGITTGQNVFVAQFYGAEEKDKIRKVVVETFISTMVLIIIFQILIFLFGSNFLNLFGQKSDLKLIELCLLSYIIYRKKNVFAMNKSLVENIQ